MGDGRRAAERRLAVCLLAPALGVVGIFALGPIGWAAWLSLRSMHLALPWLPKGFVGLANYAGLLKAPRLWAALGHTLLFVGASVGTELLLGLAAALLLRRLTIGQGFARTSLLLPWAMPTVVAAVVWRYLTNPTSGIIVVLLRGLGQGDDATVLLARPATAWAVILLTDIWKTTPFIVLILLAGLQAIPPVLYEAAAADGATAWARFRRITLPLLRPAILVALVFRTLQAVKVFDHIYALTGGGPGTATETVAFLAYDALLRELDFGFGSAAAFLVLGLSAGLAALYARLLGASRGGLA